jgi:precorrin-6A/cobalt-precorrin-6A reductase
LCLAQHGYRVLVSRATDVPLAIGDHAGIESRCGELDDDGLAELIRQRAVRAIVDATHPYAVAIRRRAGRIAERMAIPYLAFVRPTSVDPADPSVEFAADHAAAARLAFAHGRPVLLTAGSRNLVPYVEKASQTGVRLVVRVLNDPASLAACRAAGLGEDQILTGRGPYSVEANRRQIRASGIGVLVTKDSGPAGGTAEKLAAARAEGCRVVVLQRPNLGPEKAFTSAEAILKALDCSRIVP